MPVLQSINPYNSSRVVNYPQLSDLNLTVRMGRAVTAYQKYRSSTFEERGRLMKQVAAILRDRSREFAVLITNEMGKPVKEAEAEVRKCAWVCDYYAVHAEEFLRPRSR